MTFWAATDALVHIGEDPNVDPYPPEWQVYIPERLRSAYPPPGWIGNGDERWGLNPDPITADGNVSRAVHECVPRDMASSTGRRREQRQAPRSLRRKYRLSFDARARS